MLESNLVDQVQSLNHLNVRLRGSPRRNLHANTGRKEDCIKVTEVSFLVPWYMVLEDVLGDERVANFSNSSTNHDGRD